MKRCHKCSAEWVSEKKQPAVKDYCAQCGAYLHCCRNCRFHDPRVHNQCRIPNTEWAGDRAGANFCDEFEFKDDAAIAADSAKTDAARRVFDQLLADPDGAPRKPKTLDDLFGD